MRMIQLERQALIEQSSIQLPSLEETVNLFKARTKPTVAQLLSTAKADKKMLYQPRCGVGDHKEMVDLLRTLEGLSRPDILSVTIDSYTRLLKLDQASEALRTDPRKLNGYPLINHGYEKARELEMSIDAPLEIRHGSPDARLLFEVAIAGGITSFEGGGICYNLPYCKDVPLRHSLRAWSYVDRVCGKLAQHGVIIDRELFGTLSAVLMPPAISLAFTLLEGMLATNDGVRCLSISYPQGGNVVQDVAALRSILELASKYLPEGTAVYPVLHEFMGSFPKDVIEADALIFYGAMVGRLAGATKLITKSNQEAYGIPSVESNAGGIRTARMASAAMFDFVSIDESLVQEEQRWIIREVEEIIAPVLEYAQKTSLQEAIIWAFEHGYLDMPFSSSRYAKSEVLPVRDADGAIRYHSQGKLAFSRETQNRNRRLVSDSFEIKDLATRISQDIFFFSDGHYRARKAV
ncbi:MAG: methylaspartate mutase [Bdellovibrionota bacterium]